MITERQEKILNSLIKEYIDSAEPISSELLRQKSDLSVSPATIRNELQELTQQGYITQPHTSAGRVPTNKGYRYFIEITFTNESREVLPNFIAKEVQEAHKKIEKELEMARKLTELLYEISATLSYTRIHNKDTIFEMLKIIGPTQSTYDKNIYTIKELLEEFENL